MTYADKYALLKAYKIQTGDDPDQNASEPLGSKEAAQRTGQERVASMTNIEFLINKCSDDQKRNIATHYQVTTLTDLTPDQAKEAVELLTKKGKKA